MEAVHAPESGQACTLSAPAELPPVEAYAAEAEALESAFDFDEQGRIIFDDYSDTRDALNAVFGAETFDPESEAPDENERIEAAESARPETAFDWIAWAMRVDVPGATPKRRETCRAVLACLAAAVDWKPDSARYGQCFPAVRLIAAKLNVSQGTAKSALDALQAAELIRWTTPPPDARGRGRNNAYTLAPAFGIAGQAKLFTFSPPVQFLDGKTEQGLFRKTVEKLNRPVQKMDGKTERTLSVPDKKYPIRAAGREKMDTSHPERPANGAKAAGADQGKAQAAAWLRKHGVRAVSLASVAETDPERFRRVRAHVDGAGGQCGPGLIVQMLRGEADLPDAPAYTPPRMCRACGSTYCRNVDSTAPPCAANAP